MARNKSSYAVDLHWKNGVKVGTKYFATKKAAQNFAAVSRGHGKSAHIRSLKKR